MAWFNWILTTTFEKNLESEMERKISKANFGRGQYCGYLKKMGSVNKSW